MKSTGQLKEHRSNNFDVLRILLASLVIVSHSYPIYGIKGGDYLERLTVGKISFGSLGVAGFLAISGFLVYQSSQRSSGFGDFIKKRILRIFPGLFVNAVITALVVGPIVAGYAGYYTNASPYTYIVRIMLLANPQWCIPGVFDQNPFGCTMNGSLWTIVYEFVFYLLFFIPFLIAAVRRNMKWIAITLFCLLLIFHVRFPTIGYGIPFTDIKFGFLIYFGMWFSAGMALGATKKHWIEYKKIIAVISFLLFCVGLIGAFPFQIVYPALPAFIVSFGSCCTPVISSLQKYGDASYGTYVYGFLVQQTLVFYTGTKLGLWSFMALSLLITIPIAYVSWFAVEKRALRLK